MLQAMLLAGSMLAVAVTSVTAATVAGADSARPAAKASGPAKANAPAAAGGPAPAFDSTRAYRYLKEQCAFGPRDPEGEGHRRAIPYFMAHFQGLGLDVKQQPFVHTDMHDGHKIPMVNFIVTVPGKDAKRKPILFCAHWDSRPRADQEASEMLSSRPIIGANDGASGVAVLMELGNVFRKKTPQQTVYLALFDGEDYGREGSLDEYFLGARWFADNLPASGFEYALLFDMVGDKDLHFPIEQNSMKQSPKITSDIWARAKSLGLSAFEPRVGMAVWDDHMPLQEKGIPAIDVIDFDYPAWHTQGDTPDKCSAHSLGVVGRLAASLAYRSLP